MGVDVAGRLLTEIARGGCVDTASQPLLLTFMALCPEDVSRVRLGQLGPAAIATLRLINEVWGLQFRLTPQTAGASASTGGAAGGAGAASSAVSGIKRPRSSAEGAEADASDAGGASAPVVDPLTGMPITSDVAAPLSHTSILVSCMGLGIKNVAKKVT